MFLKDNVVGRLELKWNYKKVRTLQKEHTFEKTTGGTVENSAYNGMKSIES